jgi:copper homeostasis protein (lipoprotein)
MTKLPQHATAEFGKTRQRLMLAGLFVSVADAANIVLCADNRSVPVAMDADYKALEAAYLKARAKPGERLLVSLEGLLTFRPSRELTQPPRASLVVELFVGVWPGQRCPAMPDRNAQGPT